MRNPRNNVYNDTVLSKTIQKKKRLSTLAKSHDRQGIERQETGKKGVDKENQNLRQPENKKVQNRLFQSCTQIGCALLLAK